MQEGDPGKNKEKIEAQDARAGVVRYQIFYQEIIADTMRLPTPNLAMLLAGEDDFLRELGVPKEKRILITAHEREKIFHRWGSELEALGSLMDPAGRKRIEDKIKEGLSAELAKKQ